MRCALRTTEPMPAPAKLPNEPNQGGYFRPSVGRDFSRGPSMQSRLTPRGCIQGTVVLPVRHRQNGTRVSSARAAGRGCCP
jgi:hypothetical protein